MSKRKLLLADDSVTIQKVVNLTFADEGIEVIAVGDGDSAMEKVAEISPDLIMADVNMPGLTGYEICERIRQDENLRRIPVILLVGSFEPFDEDEARRVGADDYLTKPFQSIRQLVNKVTVLLNSQNGQNSDPIADTSSLEDTLEMDADEIGATSASEQNSEVTQPLQYPDTSFDDEMIQTNRPSSFAFDETQRFAARETGQLADAQQFESEAANYEDAPENLTESVSEEETENVEYEIKDKEPGVSEVESNQYSYELETNDGISYEIKEDVSDKIVSEEHEESVTAEIEDAVSVSDEVNESEESVADEITEAAPAETEESEDISAEVKDEEIISDEIEENVKSDESVLAEKSEDVSEEIKDYALVSEEVVEPLEETSTAEVKTEVSDELELGETESESEETVTIESEEDNSELPQKTSEEEIPLPEYASVLEFDDDDILQLPPIESEIEEEEEQVEKSVAAPIIMEQTETAAFVSTPINPVIDSSQISPELIEVIVAKVLERLSDKAVKEVAWEVVPQMTELIVTKMAEEKLRE